MNKSIGFIATTALGMAAFGAGATTASHLAKQANILMPQAHTIALKTYSSKIVSAELEQENGSSGLRYSFDISQGKVTHEVGVEAKTRLVRCCKTQSKAPTQTDRSIFAFDGRGNQLRLTMQISSISRGRTLHPRPSAEAACHCRHPSLSLPFGSERPVPP